MSRQIVRKIISSAAAPKPIGPYSQAVQIGDHVYLSGVIGMDDKGGLVEGGAKAQAQQALKHMQAILAAAKLSLNNVVKCTVFMEDMNDFNDVNEVYKSCFKEPYPARSAFQVSKLPKGAKVEIEAIAVVGDIVDSK